MAGYLQILQCSGTLAGTERDLVNTQFYFMTTGNVNSQPDEYAIVVPTGINVAYSYETWFRVKCIATPKISLGGFRFFGLPSIQPDYPVNKTYIYAGVCATPQTPTINASSIAIGTVHTKYTDYYTNYLSMRGTLTQMNEYLPVYIVLQMKVTAGAPFHELRPMTYHIGFFVES